MYSGSAISVFGRNAGTLPIKAQREILVKTKLNEK